jgi:group I intron endonuclease
MIGIYCIQNRINDKRYVGKSIHIEARWDEHKRLNSKSCEYIHRALQKYGVENFDFSVLEEISQETENINQVLNDRESFWIRSLDTIADHGKGYNLTYGGEGSANISEITKKRRSESLKKVPHTKDWNQKISKDHKGKKVPAIGLSKKGIPNPKVSLSQKGVPCPNRSKSQLGRKKHPKTARHIKATNLYTKQELNFDDMGDCNLYFIGRRIDSSVKKLIEGYIPVHAGRLKELYQLWKFEDIP